MVIKSLLIKSALNYCVTFCFRFRCCVERDDTKADTTAGGTAAEPDEGSAPDGDGGG